MSMCICECGQCIDSDFDPDCFVEEDGKTRILCERCREALPEDHPYWDQ